MTQPPPLPPPLPPVPEDIGQNAGIRLLLPVGRSGLAIAAGYLGLFAVLVFPAPLALAFGIFAVWDIRKSRRSPKPKHGMGRAIFGIVMGGIFTLILVIALPTLFQSRR
jgi:hypothetical protein